MVKLLVTFIAGGFLSACTSSALVVPSANYPVERLGIYEAKVHALSEIPTEILGEIDKMGVTTHHISMNMKLIFWGLCME